MIFIPVRKGDIAVGRPLPWSVYDRDSQLLHKHGHVVKTPPELEALLRNGTYRNSSRRPEAFEPCEELAGVSRRRAEATNEFLVRVEDIRFLIGDTMQLHSPPEDARTRYYVKLIGYVKRKSVLVTSPVVSGKVCLMRDGQSLIVRAFSGRNAYVFPATILRVANTPFPHLHLTYPNAARGVAVRKDCRVETNIIAAVACTRQDRANVSAAAAIVNLSIGGALLSSDTRLGNKGDRVALKFRIQLHETQSYLAVEALIRSVSHKSAPGRDGVTFKHGVQFVNVREQHAVMLTAYVYQTLLEESAVP